MSDTEKENAKTEEELHTNPMLAMRVEKDSELKEYLVEQKSYDEDDAEELIKDYEKEIKDE